MPIPAAFSTWMRGVRVWAALAAAGLVLAGLLWAGQSARDRLYHAGRYTLAFADIDCEPPAGRDRAEFLGEVQYLAAMPGRLHLLDRDLPARLAEAFARHPLVEEVRRVEVLRPRGVRVSLGYRVPVLVVFRQKIAAGTPAEARESGVYTFGGVKYLVDERGRLLGGSSGIDLPVFAGPAIPLPAGGCGVPWGDPDVEAAAATAGLLHPDRERLRLSRVRVRAGRAELETRAGSRVLWGRAPGAEAADEATAAEKVRRLLDYCAAHGNLDAPGGPFEHDVRPRDGALHRPLRSGGTEKAYPDADG